MELKEGKKHTGGLRRPFGVAGETRGLWCVETAVEVQLEMEPIRLQHTFNWFRFDFRKGS